MKNLLPKILLLLKNLFFKILPFLKDRRVWLGIVTALAVAGVELSPELREAIATLGVALGNVLGLVAV